MARQTAAHLEMSMHKFSGFRRPVASARVDGDALFVKWPDGKEGKAKIIRREKINPNEFRPA